MALSTRESDIEDAEDDLRNCTDVVYLITWNPNRKVACETSTQVMKWESMICKVLKHLERCCKIFNVVAEVSDQGRLHCHGYIVISDKIKWHKSVLPLMKSHGFMKMNKMKSHKALYYYKKDLEVTRALMPGTPICFNHINARRIIRDIRIKYLINEDVTPRKLNILDFFPVE